MTMYQIKRDFGKTAPVVVVITVSAATVTVAGLAMTQMSLVDTMDRLGGQVSKDLQRQNALNSHIKFGLLNLNQQTALLQEQVDS